MKALHKKVMAQLKGATQEINWMVSQTHTQYEGKDRRIPYDDDIIQYDAQLGEWYLSYDDEPNLPNYVPALQRQHAARLDKLKRRYLGAHLEIERLGKQVRKLEAALLEPGAPGYAMLARHFNIQWQTRQ